MVDPCRGIKKLRRVLRAPTFLPKGFQDRKRSVPDKLEIPTNGTGERLTGMEVFDHVIQQVFGLTDKEVSRFNPQVLPLVRAVSDVAPEVFFGGSFQAITLKSKGLQNRKFSVNTDGTLDAKKLLLAAEGMAITAQAKEQERIKTKFG